MVESFPIVSCEFSIGSCSTLYGPVKSRRHGLSLGVNLGQEEKKICTWGCVYCQCGYGLRRDFNEQDQRPNAAAVLTLLKEAVFKNPSIDSITFAGNSEPTSHPEFNTIARNVMKLKHSMRAKWVVNVLSNGSELDRPDVLSGLNLLDEAWVKLDCGSNDEFRRLSRPIERVGSVEQHVARIQQLRKPHIQTLLWDHDSLPRLSNYSPENSEALLKCYELIKPVSIHLTTVSRSPATSGIVPLAKEQLDLFAQMILKRGFSVTVFPE